MSKMLDVRVPGWMVDEAQALIGVKGKARVVEECLRRIIELEETRLLLAASCDLAARDEAVEEWLNSYPCKPGPLVSPLDLPLFDFEAP